MIFCPLVLSIAKRIAIVTAGKYHLSKLPLTYQHLLGILNFLHHSWATVRFVSTPHKVAMSQPSVQAPYHPGYSYITAGHIRTSPSSSCSNTRAGHMSASPSSHSKAALELDWETPCFSEAAVKPQLNKHCSPLNTLVMALSQQTDT